MEKFEGEILIKSLFLVLVKDEVISRRYRFKSYIEKIKWIFGDLNYGIFIYLKCYGGR